MGDRDPSDLSGYNKLDVVTDQCRKMTEKQDSVWILALGTGWLVLSVTVREKTRGRSCGDSGRDKSRNKNPSVGYDLP